MEAAARKGGGQHVRVGGGRGGCRCRTCWRWTRSRSGTARRAGRRAGWRARCRPGWSRHTAGWRRWRRWVASSCAADRAAAGLESATSPGVDVEPGRAGLRGGGGGDGGAVADGGDAAEAAAAADGAKRGRRPPGRRRRRRSARSRSQATCRCSRGRPRGSGPSRNATAPGVPASDLLRHGDQRRDALARGEHQVDADAPGGEACERAGFGRGGGGRAHRGEFERRQLCGQGGGGIVGGHVSGRSWGRTPRRAGCCSSGRSRSRWLRFDVSGRRLVRARRCQFGCNVAEIWSLEH